MEMRAEFLTVSEVASLLKLSESTVYTMVRAGAIPAVKLGNQWRVSETRLDEWLEEKEDSSGAEPLNEMSGWAGRQRHMAREDAE